MRPPLAPVGFLAERKAELGGVGVPAVSERLIQGPVISRSLEMGIFSTILEVKSSYLLGQRFCACFVLKFAP